jgi:hypothetical protein
VADTLTRRAGVRIDPAKLDHELACRGITAREFSQRSRVPEAMISRARHGARISEGTLRRLTGGLLQIPLMPGSDMLISAPEKKTISTPSLAEMVKESAGDAFTDLPR